MCMGGSSPKTTALAVPPPPPPPPPAPAPTAQGLTVGADRRTAPLQQFLQTAISANRRRGTTALRTDLAGVGGDTGLNIPT